MEILITTGHYQLKSSIGSDKAEIIKILGPDIEREGNWISDEMIGKVNRSIPEYILQEQYVKLSTVPTEKDLSKLKQSTQLKNKLFGDFKPITEETHIVQQQIIQPSEEIKLPINENQQKFTTENISEVRPIIEKQIQQIQQIQPVSEFDFILDKININKLNEDHFKKFGTKIHKCPIIQLQLDIELPYNIDKLKQTIELLSLDKQKLAQYLVDTTKIDFKIIFKQCLIEYLDGNIGLKEQKQINDNTFLLGSKEKIVKSPAFSEANQSIIEADLLEEITQLKEQLKFKEITIQKQHQILKDIPQKQENISLTDKELQENISKYDSIIDELSKKYSNDNRE